jgi:hypothetical protein
MRRVEALGTLTRHIQYMHLARQRADMVLNDIGSPWDEKELVQWMGGLEVKESDVSRAISSANAKDPEVLKVLLKIAEVSSYDSAREAAEALVCRERERACRVLERYLEGYEAFSEDSGGKPDNFRLKADRLSVKDVRDAISNVDKRGSGVVELLTQIEALEGPLCSRDTKEAARAALDAVAKKSQCTPIY